MRIKLDPYLFTHDALHFAHWSLSGFKALPKVYFFYQWQLNKYIK